MSAAADRSAAMRVVLEAMRDRFACKLYDSSRPVPRDVEEYILECGRLSPSSYGLEHWHFYAISTPEAIRAMRGACLDQDAVGTATLVVAIMCRTARHYDPDGEFIASRGRRFPGELSAFVEDYRGFHGGLEDAGVLDQWAKAQCYIACANMMTGAKAAGVDSCAIEGYENAKVVETLGLDPADWQTGIIASFGYAADASPREKIRIEKKGIITRV